MSTAAVERGERCNTSLVSALSPLKPSPAAVLSAAGTKPSPVTIAKSANVGSNAVRKRKSASDLITSITPKESRSRVSNNTTSCNGSSYNSPSGYSRTALTNKLSLDSACTNGFITSAQKTPTTSKPTPALVLPEVATRHQQEQRQLQLRNDLNNNQNIEQQQQQQLLIGEQVY